MDAEKHGASRLDWDGWMPLGVAPEDPAIYFHMQKSGIEHVRATLGDQQICIRMESPKSDIDWDECALPTFAKREHPVMEGSSVQHFESVA